MSDGRFSRDQLILPFVALLSLACATAPLPPAHARLPLGEITSAEVTHDVEAFAHDSMRGRLTGTDDAVRAARFLAARLQQLGLEPAGDSLYLQRVPLERETIEPASRVIVHSDRGDTELAIGAQLVPLLHPGGTGSPSTMLRAEGRMVFVGYGLPAAKGRPDDLAGIDIAGAVVVVINGAPLGADAETRRRLESPDALAQRLSRILPEHPEAVVIVLAEGQQAMITEALAQARGRVAAPRGTSDDGTLPMIVLARAAPGSPLLPAAWPASTASVAMPSQFVARLAVTRTPVPAYNVVAVIRGGDPRLATTYVALGAHYDHLGVIPAERGDSIANGADDDGSGSVALLAIARTIAASRAPPSRSLLFVWHVGEEQGLLGSSYFTEHPTVPIDSVVGQLNVDMIGRNAPERLFAIGAGAAPSAGNRRLGATIDSVNARLTRPFTIDRSRDSPADPEHLYERSDQFNYARQGIPVLFLTSGLHADYHRVSDESSRINGDKLARVAILLREAVLAIANDPKRPR